jgi:hypothetical protein
MNLSTFITETYDKDLHKTLDLIKKDCKPFLKHNIILHRGMSKQGIDAGKKSTRKNRLPRAGHALLTKFVEEFSKDNRLPSRTNNALFCTPSNKNVNIFGISHLIFPIGKFDFVWWEAIEDLNMDNGIRPLKEILDMLESYTEDRERVEKILNLKVPFISKMEALTNYI